MMNEHQRMVKEAYDASAGTYAEKNFHELDYKPLDRQLLDRFSAMVSPGGLVCDIGCGPGEIADYLHKKNLNVVGIDISDTMIQEAQRLNPDIGFHTGDMFSLEVPDNHFSGLCSFYAIVNFQYEDIRKIFHEYHRVLKKVGIVLVSFHTGEQSISVDDFYESGKPLVFYYFDEQKILELLRGPGFEILEALVRIPYREEYPSKRAYVLCVKK